MLIFALLGIFYIMLGLLWSDTVIKAWHIFIAVGMVLLVRSFELCYSWIILKRKGQAMKTAN